MDRRIVDDKLESLRRCLARIEDRRPGSLEDLQGDVDAQDIIAVYLERAVQLSVDLGGHILSGRTGLRPPGSMGETFTLLAEEGIISHGLADRMRGAVGFRNISVHAYRKIDWEVVFSIITRRVGDFREFAREISGAA